MLSQLCLVLIITQRKPLNPTSSLPYQFHAPFQYTSSSHARLSAKPLVCLGTRLPLRLHLLCSTEYALIKPVAMFEMFSLPEND